jgi:hypothetical protein
MTFVTALVIFALAASSLVQIPGMLLPEGDGAWTVHVTTSGGILGTGDRDLALSSEGRILCGLELRGPTVFLVPTLMPLIDRIQSTLPVPPVAVVSFCSDCIRRTITIRRRDPKGELITYTASWDDTTKSQLPQEVVQVYDAITALMK